MEVRRCQSNQQQQQQQGGRQDEFLVLDELQTISEQVPPPATTSIPGAGNKPGWRHQFRVPRPPSLPRARPVFPFRLQRRTDNVGFPLPPNTEAGNDRAKEEKTREWLEPWKQTCRANRTLILAFSLMFVFVVVFTSVLAVRDPYRNQVGAAARCKGDYTPPCYDGYFSGGDLPVDEEKERQREAERWRREREQERLQIRDDWN